MLPSWLVYPGVLLIVWGAITYIRDIRRGEVQPNLVTWFLWSLAPLIALGAELRGGVGAEAALTAAVGLCPLAVFIAGLRQGTFKPVAFDWWCGGASLVALILWQLTGNGIVGVGLSILADALGAAPTLRKSYNDPASESATFFAFFALSAGITLLTLQAWSFLNAAFSVYIFMLYIVLFTFVRTRIGERWRKPQAIMQMSEPEEEIEMLT